MHSVLVKRKNVKYQIWQMWKVRAERAYPLKRHPVSAVPILFFFFSFEVPQVLSNVCFVLSIDKIHLCKGLLSPLK